MINQYHFQQPAPQPCPTCGTCPTCGRSHLAPAYPVYPVYPIQPWPVISTPWHLDNGPITT